jgi:Clp amino terminal domain, pathogenicity island component
MSALIFFAELVPRKRRRPLHDFQWLSWLARNGKLCALALGARHTTEKLAQGVRPRDLPEGSLPPVVDPDTPAVLVTLSLMNQYSRSIDRGNPADAKAWLNALAAKIQNGQALKTVDFVAETAFHVARYGHLSKRAAAILGNVKSRSITQSRFLRVWAAIGLAAGDWESAILDATEARRRLTERVDFGLAAAEDDWLRDILLLAELGHAAPPSILSEALDHALDPKPTRERFDKFTLRLRTALSIAGEESRQLNHGYIGTEHLLGALTFVQGSVAVRAVTDLGVDIAHVRRAIALNIVPGARAISGAPTLTPRAKSAIEFAVDEAKRFGHSYVGTEHLLIGLAREEEGFAANVLNSLGLTVDSLRQATLVVLEAATGAPEE